MRLAVAAAGVFVAAVVFGLVGVHVMLAQNQFRLDRLNAQAKAQEASYQRLRLQVDQLESPAADRGDRRRPARDGAGRQGDLPDTVAGAGPTAVAGADARQEDPDDRRRAESRAGRGTGRVGRGQAAAGDRPVTEPPRGARCGRRRPSAPRPAPA